MLIPIREFEDRKRRDGEGPDWQYVGIRYVRESEVRSFRSFEGGYFPKFAGFVRVEITGPHGTNYEFWTDEPAKQILDRIAGAGHRNSHLWVAARDMLERLREIRDGGARDDTPEMWARIDASIALAEAAL